MEAQRGNDDPIVMVPVPTSQLGVVYRALANPPTEQVTPAQESEEWVEVRGPLGSQRWTASKIRRLEAELAHPAARALVTLVAERAPRAVTFEEAAEATGVGADLLRGAGSSLTKTANRLFDAGTWPILVRPDSAGRAVYSMDPRVAAWWIEATGGDLERLRSSSRQWSEGEEK